MGRKNLIKLSDEEIHALEKAKGTVKRFGTNTLPESVKVSLKDDALGSYVHLGSLLILRQFGLEE